MVLKPAEQLKKRIQELEEEVNTLNTSLNNQLVEIERLNSELEQTKKLETNLKKEKQKKKELEKRIQQLEIECSEVTTELSGLKEGSIKDYQDKVAKAHNEIGFLSKTIRSQEKELSIARQEVKQLHVDAAQADKEFSKQVYDTELLRIELEEVKKAIPSAAQAQEMRNQNASFKEFVKVKRELSQLRNENRKLKMKLHKELTGNELTYLAAPNPNDLPE